MKLFDVLPDRFFSLLSSQNRRIYAEAVLLLYEEYQNNKFGIQMEIVRDLFEELIQANEELGVEYVNEQEEVQQQIESDVPRFKANALIRMLKDLEWIDVEERDNLKQYIVLPHYTSRILAVLQKLCEGKVVEYQRFAFSTYQLLTGDEAALRPCVAVLEAEKMTREFIEELRTLLNNMKNHMQQVLDKTSFQEVLDHHFDEYKAKIVDQSYHRLKTSDHVARYRINILRQVQTWLLDRNWLEHAVMDGVKSGLFSNEQEAERAIRESLYFVEEVYRDLDEMFYQIDVRHNQYLRASYDRARYLTQHSHGIDQLLVDLLNWVSRIGEDSFDLPRTLFRVLDLQQIQEASLLTPRTKRPPHEAAEHVVVPVSDELKQKLREANLERMKRAITREKVRDYVLKRMGGREEIRIEELAPETVDEFLYLTFVYLYGYDGKAGYRLIKGKENRVLQIGNYRFYDRRIIKNH